MLTQWISDTWAFKTDTDSNTKILKSEAETDTDSKIEESMEQVKKKLEDPPNMKELEEQLNGDTRAFKTAFEVSEDEFEKAEDAEYETENTEHKSNNEANALCRFEEEKGDKDTLKTETVSLQPCQASSSSSSLMDCLYRFKEMKEGMLREKSNNPNWRVGNQYYNTKAFHLHDSSQIVDSRYLETIPKT